MMAVVSQNRSNDINLALFNASLFTLRETMPLKKVHIYYLYRFRILYH